MTHMQIGEHEGAACLGENFGRQMALLVKDANDALSDGDLTAFFARPLACNCCGKEPEVQTFIQACLDGYHQVFHHAA